MIERPYLRAGRHREEDREVEPAAPKLLLPGVERHILCHKVLTEARRPGFRGGRAGSDPGRYPKPRWILSSSALPGHTIARDYGVSAAGPRQVST